MKTPKLYIVVPLWVGTEYTHKGGLKYICPGHEVIIKEKKSNLGAFLIGTTTVVLVMTCCWWWISRHGIDLIALLYISLSTSRINPHGISIIHQWSTCPHNKNNSPMNSRLAAFHEHFHWKPRAVIVPTLSSQVAQDIVVMKTCDSTSDHEVGIRLTPQYLQFTYCYSTDKYHSDIITDTTMTQYQCNFSKWSSVL